jgi:hypothetical protein
MKAIDAKMSAVKLSDADMAKVKNHQATGLSRVQVDVNDGLFGFAK